MQSFAFCARNPAVLEDICKDLAKRDVDDVATSFVALAAEAGCFHPSWLLLNRPCLCGVRQPTPVSIALQQSFLMMQSTEWAQAILSPFFARMMGGKMKRKRAMKVGKKCFLFFVTMSPGRGSARVV